jgi:hypothetical protein
MMIYCARTNVSPTFINMEHGGIGDPLAVLGSDYNIEETIPVLQ